ncbi:CLUMA_CG011686, isoform A [Clunio marinus]|uniref:CLUMA_CG011686, isoform A n=1 Tax=Clunio marinus TaxID=568069 RepID=A0A1J1IFK1_9DIPT|nr:CLUMA_CG011686, isoform A [Clunio marinus]
MKSIQEYTILWNATESGTFIIQSCTPYSDDDDDTFSFQTHPQAYIGLMKVCLCHKIVVQTVMLTLNFKYERQELGTHLSRRLKFDEP